MAHFSDYEQKISQVSFLLTSSKIPKSLFVTETNLGIYEGSDRRDTPCMGEEEIDRHSGLNPSFTNITWET
jgi:hypothetical protein